MTVISDLVANTRAGALRGAQEAGVLGFKGIRYGEPADGMHRFMPPRAVEPWVGIRDALAWGPAAPQVPIARYNVLESWDTGFDAGPKSEDCLVLNVWTPRLRDGAKRPVMLYLHGGGFHGRSGSRGIYNGANLSRRGDTVVVTINQRLNVFGYMYLGHLGEQFRDSGNAGSLDAILALQWVHDNIEEFGGDPGNVTIFGQSGGAGKVNVLLGSPAARGLFHKAIVQSSAFLQGLSTAEAADLTDRFLAFLGIKSSEMHRLQTMPWQDIVAGLVKAKGKPFSDRYYAPVVDGRTLPRGPFDVSAPEISADIPVMVGNTRTETTMLLGSVDPTVFDIDEAGLRKRLAPLMTGVDVEALIAAFRATRPAASPADLLFAITTERQFRKLSITLAELKYRQQRAPVYMYEVGWRTPVDGGKWGSPHSMEHGFVFQNLDSCDTMYGPAQPVLQVMADQMSSTWLAFARHGNPNNSQLPHWPPYDPAARATMVFDDPPHVVNDPRQSDREALRDCPATNLFEARSISAAA